MRKHIKGIKITVIFLICFFSLILPAYSATTCNDTTAVHTGVFVSPASTTDCYEVVYCTDYSESWQPGYYPQTQNSINSISFTSPGNVLYGNVVSMNITSGFISYYSINFLDESGSYIASDLRYSNSNHALRVYAGGMTALEQISTINYQNPTCSVCDQTTIDEANASCPLGLGFSFCESVILLKQCEINSCADVTSAHYDTICTLVYEGDYRVGNCTYNDDGDIQITADCGNCSADQKTWGDANCIGGYKYLTFFDCENTTGTCRTPKCGELENDCSEDCWGLVEKFTCSESTGTPVITEPCICKTGAITPDPPALPDTVDNNATLSDPSDTDSGLLLKIVDNTYSTSQILDTRLHDVETSIQKSSDRASQDSQSLGQILSDLNDTITNWFKEGDYTAPGGDPHSEVPTFVDGNFTQPGGTDLQTIFSTQSIPGETSDLFTPNITTSLADPILSGDILGGTVDIDFSEYETLFQWAGNLLYFLCAIQALFIAFRN